MVGDKELRQVVCRLTQSREGGQDRRCPAQFFDQSGHHRGVVKERHPDKKAGDIPDQRPKIEPDVPLGQHPRIQHRTRSPALLFMTDTI
jgi:hypothetical protein